MATTVEHSCDLSVIVPAYMEEENLRLLLPRMVAAAEKVTASFEIIIVDTMKPMDNTREVCQQYDAVKYVPRTGGNMFGDAVRTGISASAGKYIVFMDADGSHSPSFIENLYEHKDDYDVVIASRYVEGGYTDYRPYLVWMSYVLNWVYRIVLGLQCRDVSNSYKLYQGDQLRALRLRCSNFDIIEEILYKLNKTRDLKIKELPFSFRKRMFGETKRNLPLFILAYAVTLIRLRFSDIGD